MPSLIQSLAYGEADITVMRFDRQKVRASYLDIEEKDIKTPKGASDKVITVTWKLEEEVESMDGRKLAPGKSLRDKTFVDSTDSESVEKWQAKGKRILCALCNLPTNTDQVPGFGPELKGKELMLNLTYTPSKDNPSDRELGFQNFGYYPVPAPK